MIALRHTGTGQIHLVASAESYDGEWETLPPPPADAAERPYVFSGGQWTPRPQPRCISRFDYVNLWPDAAVLAVHNTTDAPMAKAWALFANWEGPVNIDDPAVQAGIARAEFLGILTAAQAEDIRAMRPPEPA